MRKVLLLGKREVRIDIPPTFPYLLQGRGILLYRILYPLESGSLQFISISLTAKYFHNTMVFDETFTNPQPNQYPPEHAPSTLLLAS